MLCFSKVFRRKTPGISIKKKLAQYFKVITIDEFKTSSICKCCEEKVDKFMIRDNPKPYKKQEKFLVHSLLRCKNVNCNKFWDRDILGSSNILKIGKEYIWNKTRPKIFCRQNVK